MGAVEELAGIAAVPTNIGREDIDLRKPRQPVDFFTGQMPGRRFLAAFERGLGDQPEPEPWIIGRDRAREPIKSADTEVR